MSVLQNKVFVSEYGLSGGVMYYTYAIVAPDNSLVDWNQLGIPLTYEDNTISIQAKILTAVTDITGVPNLNIVLLSL